MPLGNQLAWDDKALSTHGHWAHFALVKDDYQLVLLVDVEVLLSLDLAEAVDIALGLDEVRLVLVLLHRLFHLGIRT